MIEIKRSLPVGGNVILFLILSLGSISNLSLDTMVNVIDVTSLHDSL